MPTAVKIEGVSKRYKLRQNSQFRYRSLRDELARWLTRPVRAMQRRAGPSSDSSASLATSADFWALDDVSFDVEQGSVTGIIGRNGAGKSTLLKILSRITEPTRGRIEITGRIASLLEVGTGFHPELTGRENIFLNGAILGMSRAEIQTRFDEIVAFAEVERFLDTPVKRYSSGMYVRLAFAIAAHLEPEILVVDEVLAVGDAQFQKKCIGKMEDVSKRKGRTVLFVSHNMGVIAQLCSRTILLERGRLILNDQTSTVLDFYASQSNEEVASIRKAPVVGENRFTLLHMADREGARRAQFKFDEEVILTVEVGLDKFSDDLELGLRLMDRYKNPVFSISEPFVKYRQNGSKLIRLNVVVPPIFITPGKYSWVISIHKPGVAVEETHDDVLQFHVIDTGSEWAKYGAVNYGSVFARYSIENITDLRLGSSPT